MTRLEKQILRKREEVRELRRKNEEQKQLAEKYKKELDASGAWDNPVVTEIAPFTKFYSAEKYHQEYYKNNANQPYCSMVIQPKVDKFRKVFKDSKINKEN